MSKRPRSPKRVARKAEATAPDMAFAGLGGMADRRAMERIHAQIGRLLRSQNFASMDEANAFLAQHTGPGGLDVEAPPQTDVERAQDVMYDAWGERDPKKRVALAKKALEVSPDCADAYVLLAEETAKTPEEARDLCEQGVAAGERALGPEYFAENAGHFWGLLETRPYMRAREGLAQVLWALDERDAAIERYRELLRLNPGDNQGIRYLLLAALLETGRDDETQQLLDQYRDEVSALWLYGRVLVAFRRHGKGAEARRRLKKALEYNPFVPMYLLGLRELPRERPPFYGLGDEAEAQEYVHTYGIPWFETPGAIEWLAEAVLDLMGPTAQRVAQRRPRTRRRP